jgi:site-specific recombinase
VNVIEEFQTLIREVDQWQRNEDRKLAEEKIRLLLELLHQKNVTLKQDIKRLHEAARLVSSELGSTTSSLFINVGIIMVDAALLTRASNTYPPEP